MSQQRDVRALEVPLLESNGDPTNAQSGERTVEHVKSCAVVERNNSAAHVVAATKCAAGIRGPGALGLVTPFALRALRALCFVVLRAASPRCWWRGFAAVLVARLRRGVGGAASPRCWLRGFAAN